MEQEAKKSFIINVVFAVLVVALVWFCGIFLLKFLLPFVIGTVLAFVVQKPAESLSAKIHIGKSVCAACLVVLIYLISISVLAIIIWQLTVQSAGFITSLPKQMENITNIFDGMNENINKMFSKLPQSTAETIKNTFQNSIQNIISSLTGTFSKFIASVVGMAPSFIFSTVVTIIASCYIAKDFERLKKFLKGIITPSAAKTVAHIKNIFTSSILKIIAGYLTLSFLTFLELSIGFFILKVRYALVIALIVAIVDLLPVLGSGIVILPWAAYNFVVGNFNLGLGLCILYLVVIIVRYFAEPRIIADKIGLNPLFVLLSMFLGLKLAGFLGFAVLPIALIVTINYYKQQMKI